MHLRTSEPIFAKFETQTLGLQQVRQKYNTLRKFAACKIICRVHPIQRTVNNFFAAGHTKKYGK
jgi:hypothetical protein